MIKPCSVCYSTDVQNSIGGGVYCGSRGVIEWSKSKLKTNWSGDLKVHCISQKCNNYWTPDFLLIILNKVEFEQINIEYTTLSAKIMNDAVRGVNSKGDYWGFKQKSLGSEYYTCIKCYSQWNDTPNRNRNQKYNIWIQDYSSNYLSRVNELFTTKSGPNCENLIFKNGGCNYMMGEIGKHEFCWSGLQIFDTHIHSDSIKCEKKTFQNNQLIVPLIGAVIMKLYFAAPLVIYTSMIILNYLLIFAIGNIMLAGAIVEVVFIKILSNFERDFREILKDNTDVVTRILTILSIIYPFCYFIACYVLWQNFYFRSAFIILLAELFGITLLYIIYLCVGKKQKTYIYIFAENIFYNMI